MFKKLVLVSALTLATMSVYAQSLTAGKDYTPLSIGSTQTIANPVAGKPLVIEFFWYGCPHCYHMEPMVKKMISDHKGDFTYKRYPVVFPHWESGAKLYFTLEEMGLVDKLHDKVFSTIQDKHINIMDDKVARDNFLKQEGVDVTKFDATYNSFAVSTKMNQAKAYSLAYKLDSTPTFVVNNAYEVNPGLTGSYESTIKSVNALIEQVKHKK